MVLGRPQFQNPEARAEALSRHVFKLHWEFSEAYREVVPDFLRQAAMHIVDVKTEKKMRALRKKWDEYWRAVEAWMVTK
jgi:hypothetical protein